MPIPLLEGERGALPFIVNRTTPFVTESRNGVTFTRIPGRFSICDSVNGNNRRYPKKVWEKNLAEGSVLRQAISKNAAFGLLEHPNDGRISLLSPICILVTDAKLQAGDDNGKQVNEVVGEIIVLNTAEGQKLRALIEAGYNPLVSSRGFGSVIKASDGIDEVQEDYVCEGWDVVLRPSFEKAELWVPRESESKQEQQEKAHEKALAESAKGINMWRVYQHFATLEHKKSFALLSEPQQEAIVSKVAALTHEDIQKIDSAFDVAKKENLEAASSTPKAATLAASKPKLTETVMTIQEIRSRIGQVRGIAVPKDPARFAEGLNEMAQIHQEIANYVAEDQKRGWEGTKLHDELSRIEKAWSESALAPSKAATKLNESYTKVLRVTKVLGEAAVNIRKKLSEALSQNAEAAQLIEELTERGQAWVAVADKRKATIEDLEHKLSVACEALDIIRDRYNEDMTDMGRRVITLEFAEKAQTESIQKALKEAKLPKDIIAIREQLDPKSKEAPKADESKKDAPKTDESKKDAPKTEPKNESKKDAPAPAPQQEDKKDSTPAAPAVPEARVLVPSVHSVTESVAMVQRLSASRLTEAERREMEKAKAEPAAK